jgi:hypothetical protein
MASAPSVCTCIKTASGTPTCEECVKWLQPPIRHQHCRKSVNGKSVHSPHKGLWPHTLERGPVPLHDCCRFFHLPSQCRYRHNGGRLLIGPKELTTTCHDAIRQLAVPPQCYDDDENSIASAALPFAAGDVDEDVMAPSLRDSVPSGNNLAPPDRKFSKSCV